MITVCLAYAIAAAAASALLAFGEWRHLLGLGRATRPRGARPRDGGPGVNAHAAVPGDVAAAVRVALGRIAPLMTRAFVRMEMAVPPGLVARMRDATLCDMIEEVLTAAIHAAPTSRLLLTACAQGDHIEIGVTDDLPNADQAYRLAQIRTLHERVALRGGTLHVTARATEGTTIAIRLPGTRDPSGPPERNAMSTAAPLSQASVRMA